MTREEKIVKFNANHIYFVTCEILSKGLSDEQVVKEVLEGGVGLIQLRDKTSSKKKILEKAEKLRNLTYAYEALLIINDHIDIALAVNADGIHLGQEDLPVEKARKICNTIKSNMLIGMSTHNCEEIELAQKQDIDYINIGPIYQTNTKKNIYFPIGEKLLKKYSKINFPFSVMGGIKKQHLPFLKQLVYNHPIAMISEICKHKYIKEHVKSLLDILKTKNNQKIL